MSFVLIAATLIASHDTSARRVWIAGPCDGVVNILFINKASTLALFIV
jgi:hypothetical protein